MPERACFPPRGPKHSVQTPKYPSCACRPAPAEFSAFLADASLPLLLCHVIRVLTNFRRRPGASPGHGKKNVGSPGARFQAATLPPAFRSATGFAPLPLHGPRQKNRPERVPCVSSTASLEPADWGRYSPPPLIRISSAGGPASGCPLLAPAAPNAAFPRPGSGIDRQICGPPSPPLPRPPLVPARLHPPQTIPPHHFELLASLAAAVPLTYPQSLSYSSFKKAAAWCPLYSAKLTPYLPAHSWGHPPPPAVQYHPPIPPSPSRSEQ